MSFNTSYIQADTLSAGVSMSAPIHYVDSIPISKNNAGNLNLGSNDYSIVECLTLTAGTQVGAPAGVFDAVSTGEIIP